MSETRSNGSESSWEDEGPVSPGSLGVRNTTAARNRAERLQEQDSYFAAAGLTEGGDEVGADPSVPPLDIMKMFTKAVEIDVEREFGGNSDVVNVQAERNHAEKLLEQERYFAATGLAEGGDGFDFGPLSPLDIMKMFKKSVESEVQGEFGNGSQNVNLQESNQILRKLVELMLEHIEVLVSSLEEVRREAENRTTQMQRHLRSSADITRSTVYKLSEWGEEVQNLVSRKCHAEEDAHDLKRMVDALQKENEYLRLHAGNLRHDIGSLLTIMNKARTTGNWVMDCVTFCEISPEEVYGPVCNISAQQADIVTSDAIVDKNSDVQLENPNVSVAELCPEPDLASQRPKTIDITQPLVDNSSCLDTPPNCSTPFSSHEKMQQVGVAELCPEPDLASRRPKTIDVTQPLVDNSSCLDTPPNCSTPFSSHEEMQQVGVAELCPEPDLASQRPKTIDITQPLVDNSSCLDTPPNCSTPFSSHEKMQQVGVAELSPEPDLASRRPKTIDVTQPLVDNSSCLDTPPNCLTPFSSHEKMQQVGVAELFPEPDPAPRRPKTMDVTQPLVDNSSCLEPPPNCSTPFSFHGKMQQVGVAELCPEPDLASQRPKTIDITQPLVDNSSCLDTPPNCSTPFSSHEKMQQVGVAELCPEPDLASRRPKTIDVTQPLVDNSSCLDTPPNCSTPFSSHEEMQQVGVTELCPEPDLASQRPKTIDITQPLVDNSSCLDTPPNCSTPFSSHEKMQQVGVAELSPEPDLASRRPKTIDVTQPLVDNSSCLDTPPNCLTPFSSHEKMQQVGVAELFPEPDPAPRRPKTMDVTQPLVDNSSCLEPPPNCSTPFSFHGKMQQVGVAELCPEPDLASRRPKTIDVTQPLVDNSSCLDTPPNCSTPFSSHEKMQQVGVAELFPEPDPAPRRLKTMDVTQPLVDNSSCLEPPPNCSTPFSFHGKMQQVGVAELCPEPDLASRRPKTIDVTQLLVDNSSCLDTPPNCSTPFSSHENMQQVGVAELFPEPDLAPRRPKTIDVTQPLVDNSSCLEPPPNCSTPFSFHGKMQQVDVAELFPEPDLASQRPKTIDATQPLVNNSSCLDTPPNCSTPSSHVKMQQGTKRSLLAFTPIARKWQEEDSSECTCDSFENVFLSFKRGVNKVRRHLVFSTPKKKRAAFHRKPIRSKTVEATDTLNVPVTAGSENWTHVSLTTQTGANVAVCCREVHNRPQKFQDVIAETKAAGRELGEKGVQTDAEYEELDSLSTMVPWENSVSVLEAESTMELGSGIDFLSRSASEESGFFSSWRRKGRNAPKRCLLCNLPKRVPYHHQNAQQADAAVSTECALVGIEDEESTPVSVSIQTDSTIVACCQSDHRHPPVLNHVITQTDVSDKGFGVTGTQTDVEWENFPSTGHQEIDRELRSLKERLNCAVEEVQSKNMLAAQLQTHLDSALKQVEMSTQALHNLEKKLQLSREQCESLKEQLASAQDKLQDAEKATQVERMANAQFQAEIQNLALTVQHLQAALINLKKNGGPSSRESSSGVPRVHDV